MTNNRPDPHPGLMLIVTAVLMAALVAMPTILLWLAIVGRTPADWASQ